jgi:signal peptidase I
MQAEARPARMRARDDLAPVEPGAPHASPVPEGTEGLDGLDVRRPRRARRRAGAALWTGLQLGSVLCAASLLFHFSIVRGSSMAPGIHDGDRIVVDHLAYLVGGVGRGDVVVLRYPLDPSVDYIKRVIGLPGDEVLIENGRVHVNGAQIEEPYAAEPDPRSSISLRVEPGTYFVLGDNRRHSADSREFGLVPAENLVGKVDLRVWPPERAGFVR